MLPGGLPDERRPGGAGVRKPRHPGLETRAERQPLPLDSNPSCSHFISIAFHPALCRQLIAPIRLCPLPGVCLPGFAICLRLSLPP